MKFKFRRYYLYYLARVAAFFVYLLPARVGLSAAGMFGYLAYLVSGRYRRITLDNLRFAFGKEKNERELKLIGRAVFENLAKNAFEVINFAKINKNNIGRVVEIKNGGRLDRALEKGKGVIILTAHFGNWELLGAALRLNGYDGPVIGRRIYFKKYDEYLNSLRKIHDVRIVYRDESPKKVLKILKDNGMIGILADQDVDSVDGVFVDFFGKRAYTPIGPAALAMATGAAVVPTLIIRRGARHDLVIEEPVEMVDTGDKAKDILENTKRWSLVIESYIKRYPEQWVWMHRRWKTQSAV